jgi:hypothetical protein
MDCRPDSGGGGGRAAAGLGRLGHTELPYTVTRRRLGPGPAGPG